MAEVLSEYETTIRDRDGREFIARACGRECDDGHWEGWLEFVPLDGGIVVRSGRETTQPNRIDTAYWATGLTPVYLEGALRRALVPVEIARRVIELKPAYDGPAPERPAISVSGAAARRARPVLNPFLVYEQGEDVLRAELGALDGPRLRDIIRGFSLRPDTAELMRDSKAELTDIIISSMSSRTSGRGTERDRETGAVSAEG
ncbi:MAG: hypothetical protein ACT4PJ_11180 [Gemmatimonadaceae bacterium]